MKKTLIYFATVIFFNILISCETKTHRDYKARMNDVEYRQDSLAIAKQKQFNVYVDSIGNLSFFGIELGASFFDVIKELQNNKNVKNIKTTNKFCTLHCTCNMMILLPNEKQPIPIDLKISSYQDTIYNIIVGTNNYWDSKELKNLYLLKYDLKFASEYNTDYEYDIVTRDVRDEKYKWILGNQSLSICMDYFVYAGGYNTTPKIYLETIRDKTKIESNIYFNNIEIEYKNDLISKKVSQLNDEERERVHKLYELRKMEMEKQELLEKTNRETNFIKNI